MVAEYHCPLYSTEFTMSIDISYRPIYIYIVDISRITIRFNYDYRLLKRVGINKSINLL